MGDKKIKTPKEMAEKEVNKKLAKEIAKKEIEKRRLQAKIKKIDKDISKIEKGELIPDTEDDESSDSSTHISFILDESGSMSGSGAIKTFDEYIQTMKKEKGNITLTLTKFNSAGVNIHIKNKKVKDIKGLDKFEPAGMTPLYDAIGKTINSVNSKGKKLFVILTDGCENCSKEFSEASIKALIKDKENKGWKFLYLGVSQAAWGGNVGLGISKGNTLNVLSGEMRAGVMSFAMSSRSFHRTGKIKPFK